MVFEVRTDKDYYNKKSSPYKSSYLDDYYTRPSTPSYSYLNASPYNIPVSLNELPSARNSYNTQPFAASYASIPLDYTASQPHITSSIPFDYAYTSPTPVDLLSGNIRPIVPTTTTTSKPIDYTYTTPITPVDNFSGNIRPIVPTNTNPTTTTTITTSKPFDYTYAGNQPLSSTYNPPYGTAKLIDHNTNTHVIPVEIPDSGNLRSINPISSNLTVQTGKDYFSTPESPAKSSYQNNVTYASYHDYVKNPITSNTNYLNTSPLKKSSYIDDLSYTRPSTYTTLPLEYNYTASPAIKKSYILDSDQSYKRSSYISDPLVPIKNSFVFNTDYTKPHSLDAADRALAASEALRAQIENRKKSTAPGSYLLH